MAGCWPGLQGSYHNSFDREILQASVPRGVKDHRQRLVWGLDVANLHFVLEGYREAAACVTVLTPKAPCGADLSYQAIAVKNKFSIIPQPREWP